MALSARLEMRQGQSLVMTPQLMQAIKLLQLSHLDLAAYVEAELERNPLLERLEDAADEDRGPLESREPVEDGDRADWFESDGALAPDRLENAFDTDIVNLFPEDAPATPVVCLSAALDAGARAESQWPVGGGDHDGLGFESYLTEEPSLHDHLVAQLTLATDDPVLLLIGRDLLEAVDEAGYLRADLDEVAERLGATKDDVFQALKLLQGFEPTGVCARDLAECLAIQLSERNRLDPAMTALLDHIALLAQRNMAQLRLVCGVDEEDLAEMLREIRALNPKPGNLFGHTVVQPVIPDVLVTPAPDGGWRVELNSETLPRVLVNQSYHARIGRAARSDGERQYLSDCLQTANWLMKSLDQRAKTILKVASEIVRQQDGFLAHGVSHLRPLNLKMIADAIGMHESTVSRVTSNKYMATGRGIFELKYFFTSSIASAEGGEAHSAEAVRHKIRQLVDAESPDDILSDDTLVKMLREAGIDIARRTVAKYREAMRIPSSVQRRRQKQTAATV